ncbi:MAG TPA: hypothetical protein VGN88_03775 [Phycisphaerae bacterium]|jgi:hypothetical protein
MKRRRIPIFSLISLVLCLAISALWIRSYYVCDNFTWDFQHASKPHWLTQWAFASRTGCFDVGRIEYGPDKPGWFLDEIFYTSDGTASGLSSHHIPKPDDDIMDSWLRSDFIWKRWGFFSQDVVVAPMIDMGQIISPDVTGWQSTYPFWLPFLLTAALPLFRLPRLFFFLRARRRTSTIRCSQCAYDLRAHHPGDKCPECGTLVPPKIPLRPSTLQPPS